MRISIATGLCLVLALTGVAVSAQDIVQPAGKVQATVFLIGVQQPFVVRDFTINNERFYDALREGKPAKLLFQDLKEILFLNPGKNHEVEVLFHDGRKERHTLKPAQDIEITTGGTAVSIGHSKVSRIAFGPMPVEQPRAAAPPQISPHLRPGLQSAAADRIILKGGDVLSGNVRTPAFSIRTAYGTFQIETPRIASIEFDEKGAKTGAVILRNGDRLSGEIEAEAVLFVMTSGDEIRFDGKTVKAIHFKR